MGAYWDSLPQSNEPPSPGGGETPEQERIRLQREADARGAGEQLGACDYCGSARHSFTTHWRVANYTVPVIVCPHWFLNHPRL